MKLSPAQQRVMKWLLGGWEAVSIHGASVTVNGERICNLDTMTKLERLGLVERHNTVYWRATDKAKREAGE